MIGHKTLAWPCVGVALCKQSEPVCLCLPAFISAALLTLKCASCNGVCIITKWWCRRRATAPPHSHGQKCVHCLHPCQKAVPLQPQAVLVLISLKSASLPLERCDCLTRVLHGVPQKRVAAGAAAPKQTARRATAHPACPPRRWAACGTTSATKSLPMSTRSSGSLTRCTRRGGSFTSPPALVLR